MDPEFTAKAIEAAKLTGYCVIEWFECNECEFHGVAAHHFSESFECPNCGHRNGSMLPRLPRPGEITVEMLQGAMSMIRRIISRPKPETIDWMNRQEGAVRCIAATYGAEVTHQMLDKIEELARDMSGGHTSGKAK